VIDLTSPSGSVRLAPTDFDALVEVTRDRSGRDSVIAGPDMAAALADDRLGAMLNVVVDPAIELRLVVAGPETRVEHRGWLAGDALVLLLWVRPELRQLMSTDRAFLTATLVRLTRMRPRHLADRVPADFPAATLDELVSTDPRLRALALADARADFAWRLDLTSEGGRRTLTAVDGDLGLRLADPDKDRLMPVTNTFAYRVLSTVLA
jgi:hypothetical protein